MENNLQRDIDFTIHLNMLKFLLESNVITETILRNEKYKGDVLTQKTYCSNLLEHKRVKNTVLT